MDLRLMSKIMAFLMISGLMMYEVSGVNRRLHCKPCKAYRVDAPPCCARNMGRFNPYYYVYRGYFRTYNWRMTPLNVNRLMGPQAFMGPTS